MIAVIAAVLSCHFTYQARGTNATRRHGSLFLALPKCPSSCALRAARIALIIAFSSHFSPILIILHPIASSLRGSASVEALEVVPIPPRKPRRLVPFSLAIALPYHSQYLQWIISVTMNLYLIETAVYLFCILYKSPAEFKPANQGLFSRLLRPRALFSVDLT